MKIRKLANFVVKDGDFIEFIGPGNGATGENGNWRIIINGTDLRHEYREGGAWVEKYSSTP